MGKIFLSMLLALTLISPAAAETRPTSSPRDTRRDVREEIKDTRKDAREEMKDKRQEVREEVKDKRADLREDMKEKREKFREEVKEKREDLRNKIKEKREDLKKRLEQIKDERKKKLVEKIDAELDALNDRRLRHYSEVLDKLEKMLERIDERADRAEERGVNVAPVRKAIEDATKAIAASREAIKTQAGKTYKIEVTTEAGLKEAVQRARRALHADLKKVEETVKAARKSVQNAAVTLAELPRPERPTSATSTPPTATSTNQ